MDEALALIANERQRQVEQEGRTSEHDDAHTRGELAWAAASYAMPLRREHRVPVSWPWDDKYWKPTPDDRVRELVKAGALIVAEIERVQRAAS